MNTSDPASKRPGSGRAVALAIGLALLLILVYWPVHAHPFSSYDDISYVTENQHVLGGLTAAGVVWAFTTAACSNYHPLVWLVEMATVSCFGANPAAFHLLNVFLHSAASALLLIFLYRSTERLWRSAFVAAVFALHPLRVESVAWVAELKDVLSTFFLVVTLLLWSAYLRRGGKGKRLYYVAALSVFAMGLLAKPMLVTVPVLLLLLDVWPFQRLTLPAPWFDLRRLILEKVPFALLATASAIATLIAQQAGGAIATIQSTPLDARFENAILAFALYIRDTFWPTQLSIAYAHAGLMGHSIAGGPVLTASVVLATVTFAVVASARRGMIAPAVGWLWYLISLLPVIGLVQVGLAARADRYTYVPHIGLLIMFVWLLADGVLKKLPKAVAAVGCLAVLAALAMTTRTQIGYWRDDLTLTEHAIALDPRNTFARLIRGQVLLGQGRAAEAAAQFAYAAQALPTSAKIQRSLAEAMAAGGRPDLALQRYQHALALDPGILEPRPRSRYFYAFSLASTGDFVHAAEQWEVYLSLAPRDIDARCGLAHAYAVLGRTADSRKQLEIAGQLSPQSTEIKSKLADLAGPATRP